jgi:hypothetical protein
MSDCPHTEIVLLPAPAKKRRCRHCHLTLSAEELGDGCCPECFDVTGRRRYDFEDVAAGDDGGPRYRCEICGAILNPAG